MSSVTTESAADTVVVLAPATDVHSAPSNKGVVPTTDVLPTIQLGMKTNMSKSMKKCYKYIQIICLGGGGGPTNNPTAGALSDPCGQPTKFKGEKGIKRKKKDWKRDECQDEEEEQVQYL